MCDYCHDTGMIHVLRFYKSKRTPYEMVEPCFCNLGLDMSKGRYCFQKSMIGLHYTLVRQLPMVFIDDRVYDYDPNVSKSHRVKEIQPLTKAQIKERLQVPTKDGGTMCAFVIGKVG